MVTVLCWILCYTNYLRGILFVNQPHQVRDGTYQFSMCRVIVTRAIGCRMSRLSLPLLVHFLVNGLEGSREELFYSGMCSVQHTERSSAEGKVKPTWLDYANYIITGSTLCDCVCGTFTINSNALRSYNFKNIYLSLREIGHSCLQ